MGTNPCIVIFTVGIPHNKSKKAKFINFENYGYVVSRHVGLIDDGSGKDKKQHHITATANNNGIGYFVGNNKTLESDCISVNRNGSVEYAFYSCYEVLYCNDTRKLKPFRKNKYSELFITHAITSQKDKCGYGYKVETGSLKRQKIMLPVSDGEINYKHMENFIKNVLKYLDKYIIYNHFDMVDWRAFFLGEVCNINSGIRLTKANMENGDIPFI